MATIKRYELDDGNARFMQMIPVFISLGVMALTPLYAEKSLKIYRALQVYRSQPLGERDYSEYENKNFFKKYFVPISILFTQLLNAIIILPSNTENLEKDWPIFSRFRDSIPFVFIGLAAYFGLVNVCIPLLFEEVRVTGHPIDEKNKNSYTQFSTSSFSYIDRQKSYNSLRIKCATAAVLLTGFSVLTRKDGNLIVLLIALSSTFLSFRALGNTFGIFEKISFRLHIRRMIMTLMITVAILLICAGIVFGIVLTMIYFFSTGQPAIQKTPEQKAAAAPSEVVLTQIICLIQVFIWPSCLFFPARLLTFAYRYDASKQGLTFISDYARMQAVSESKQMTIPAKPITSAKHHLDCLGRTPVDINTKALQIKDAIGYRLSWNISASFPVFDIAFKIILGLHLSFIVFETSLIQPDFNIAFFARTGNQISYWYNHFIAINIMAIVSYFALLVVIPTSAAFTAKRNRNSHLSGLRALWQYEEDWNINHVQGILSPSIPLGLHNGHNQEEATEMKQFLSSNDDIAKLPL